MITLIENVLPVCTQLHDYSRNFSLYFMGGFVTNPAFLPHISPTIRIGLRGGGGGGGDVYSTDVPLALPRSG